MLYRLGSTGLATDGSAEGLPDGGPPTCTTSRKRVPPPVAKTHPTYLHHQEAREVALWEMAIAVLALISANTI